jgi:2-keto-3-deoxy-L-fuconate dehydrogenase
VFDLSGKTCLVTAAGQGIGRATAVALRDAGANVIATDLNPALVSALAAEADITAYPLDVTDQLALAALADRIGAVDVLCHCAGFVHDGTVLDVDTAAFDFSFDLNVRSAFRMAQMVLPGMQARGSGALIFIASVASAIKGVPRRAVYGASKAAVLGLSKSIAADFVGSGIRSNCICPGTVETPSLAQRIEAKGGDFATEHAAFVGRQPMGRLGRAEEIAALAVYLASDRAAFVTGQAIAIDGGWTI